MAYLPSTLRSTHRPYGTTLEKLQKLHAQREQVLATSTDTQPVAYGMMGAQPPQTIYAGYHDPGYAEEIKHLEAMLIEKDKLLYEHDEIIEALVHDLNALRAENEKLKLRARADKIGGAISSHGWTGLMETAATEADADGWIPWEATKASVRPVPGTQRVAVWLECYSGARNTGNRDRASFYTWRQCNGGTIVAYKVLEKEP